MSQAWRVEGEPWLGSEEMGARRATRSSDPTGNDGFYTPSPAASYRPDAAPNGYGHRHDSRSLDAGDGRERKGSGDEGSRPSTAGETSSYTTSSQEPASAAARPRIKTATSRSGSSGPGHSPSAPARTSSPPAISLAGSSAMLEAARSSQSRRR
jgi:hypothetical protein